MNIKEGVVTPFVRASDFFVAPSHGAIITPDRGRSEMK
jgi:hypothetical protein